MDTSRAQLSNVGVVILAAGRGTRLNCVDFPKAMLELNGKPMVSHLVDTVRAAGFSSEQICLVIGYHREKVKEYFGDSVQYAVQEEQLGTGHAVATAREVMGGVKDIVVLYGDMPFVSADSVTRLLTRHRERDNTVTLMTVTVPNFEGQYAPLRAFGRVVRNTVDTHIVKTVEVKDCTPDELQITELNPCYYCFKSAWLWEHIATLNNNNAQKEFYLTDLVGLAIKQGEKISSISIDPTEAIGINTPEDLGLAKELLNK